MVERAAPIPSAALSQSKYQYQQMIEFDFHHIKSSRTSKIHQRRWYDH
jgi:hypothetical protein